MTHKSNIYVNEQVKQQARSLAEANFSGSSLEYNSEEESGIQIVDDLAIFDDYYDGARDAYASNGDTDFSLYRFKDVNVFVVKNHHDHFSLFFEPTTTTIEDLILKMDARYQSGDLDQFQVLVDFGFDISPPALTEDDSKSSNFRVWKKSYLAYPDAPAQLKSGYAHPEDDDVTVHLTFESWKAASSWIDQQEETYDLSRYEYRFPDFIICNGIS